LGDKNLILQAVNMIKYLFCPALHHAAERFKQVGKWAEKNLESVVWQQWQGRQYPVIGSVPT
jgi:hypothetical protein